MDRADLERRLGGPVGDHARRRGSWFDPGPWVLAAATTLWLLTLLRHAPCRQVRADAPVDPYLRLCYSDIALLYQNGPLGRGGLPYRDLSLEQPPLVGLFVLLTRKLSWLFGARPRPGATAQQVVDGAHAFLLAAGVLLGACLLLLVACHLLLGRGSAARDRAGLGARIRSRDAWFVATAPAVLTAGLVSWDLLAAALVAAGLLAWAARRQLAAGVLLGLGVTAGPWVVLVVVALLLACRRAGMVAAWGRTAGAAAAAVVVVTLLCWLVTGRTGWAPLLMGWWGHEADLGSVWFVMAQLGVIVPGLRWVTVALGLAWTLWVARLAHTAPRRPRVAQLAFLLVAGWLLVDTGYTPQQVLWLAPLVALARPDVFDWLVWAGAEALYWWAVWGHLGGQLTPGDGSADSAYWAAILFRVLVLAWLVGQVVRDVRRPWLDPVRVRLADDPAGGILDHAPDAAPVVRPAPERGMAQ